MENPFTTISDQLANLNAKLDKALALIPDAETELLTPQEFAKVVKKSMPTIWRWESEGKIKPTIIAGKKFYRNPKAN